MRIFIFILVLIIAFLSSYSLSGAATYDNLKGCSESIQCNIPDPVGTDYWSTPEETCLRGGGDCDDFAAIDFFKYESVGAWFVLGVVDGTPHAWVLLGEYILDSCYQGGERTVIAFVRRDYYITPDGFMHLSSSLAKWTDLLSRQDAYVKGLTD